MVSGFIVDPAMLLLQSPSGGWQNELTLLGRVGIFAVFNRENICT